MGVPKLSKLELQIMEVLWDRGPCCVRDIVETFPARKRPAYTTIQTTIYRLEAKKGVQLSRKVGNVHVFEAVISRSAAQRRLIDEFLGLFGGRTQPLMTHLIESGRLTPEDFKEAQKVFQNLSRKEKSE
jgi:BlaI family transcriptional regulator, penicillinase repressor